MNAESDIRQIKGIGEKTAKLFHNLNIYCVKDLLEHYPRDYETLGGIREVSSLCAGECATVRVTVTSAPKVIHARGMSILNIAAADATGSIKITYFNAPFLKNVFRAGGSYVVRGSFRQDGEQLALQHPKLFKKEEYLALAGTIQPQYPLTAGLTDHTVIKALRQALYGEDAGTEEFLPEEVLAAYRLIGYKEALRGIHFPGAQAELQEARRRLVFHEFLLFLLQLKRLKLTAMTVRNRLPMPDAAAAEKLIEALPYRLTQAQKTVWEEVKADLSGEFVMSRLIQGDVGSGKTIIALLALLLCAANGYQGALMAPTEVLARQHYEQALRLVEQYGLCLKPVLLTGSVTQAARRKIYREIAEGCVNLIIGTHALIQEKVEYQSLALVVTDEQHRFGVRQREALAGKGESVHVLVMSATPIPRTLGMILYGDLHISAVRELPAERLPIKNCVVGQEYRKTAYRFIEKEAAKGRQAYVICPMVEAGELEDVENVTDYAIRLKEELAPGIRTGILHGKMKPSEKNRIMEQFAAGEIDVLVSTTVVEVGVNVPNATVMMIENAERFGLAQLHQLRGRVGRGREQSYCIFVSGSDSEAAKKRLDIVNNSNDGFEIAEQDLKLRGPGELFGLRQSGGLCFAIGDIFRDADVLREAYECAEELFGRMSDRPQDYAPLLARLEGSEHNQVDFQSL